MSEINRRIAVVKALRDGWQIQRYEQGEFENYRLIRPDGSWYLAGIGFENDAREMLASHLVQPCDTDLNAAIVLFWELPNAEVRPLGIVWDKNDMEKNIVYLADHTPEALAAAICAVWLQVFDTEKVESE